MKSDTPAYNIGLEDLCIGSEFLEKGEFIWRVRTNNERVYFVETLQKHNFHKDDGFLNTKYRLNMKYGTVMKNGTCTISRKLYSTDEINLDKMGLGNKF